MAHAVRSTQILASPDASPGRLLVPKRLKIQSQRIVLSLTKGGAAGASVVGEEIALCDDFLLIVEGQRGP